MSYSRHCILEYLRIVCYTYENDKSHGLQRVNYSPVMELHIAG